MSKHQLLAVVGLVFAVLAIFVTGYPLLAIAVIFLALSLLTFGQ